jgi:phosphoglycerate-specific signal transduction histidine kinase
MLMARRNLDQPLGDSKNTLIKFNEQIASKYRSGLSLRFLDSYTKKNVVPNSIKQFYIQNQVKQVSRIDFENILKSNTDKDINWF